MDLKKEVSESNGELNYDSVSGTVGLASSLSPMDNSATTTPNVARTKHEFEIPNSIAGLVIGVKGTKIKELRRRSGALIEIRKHDDPAKVDSHQICQVRGTLEQVNHCLQMLRNYFPSKRYPEFNPQPVLSPSLPSNFADVEMETDDSESNGELNDGTKSSVEAPESLDHVQFKVAFLEQKLERMRAESLMHRKNMAKCFDTVYMMQDREQDKLYEEAEVLRKAVYGDDVDKPINKKEEDEEANEEEEEAAIDESLQHLMASLRSEKHKKELEQISATFKAVLALKKRKIEQQKEKVEVKEEDDKGTKDGSHAHTEATDVSIYFKFNKVSKIASVPVYHKPAVLNGVEWLVSLHKNGDYLACTVAGKTISGASFPNATVEFDVSSAEDYSHDHYKTLEKRVHEGTQFYENLEFIPLKDLFDEKKRLVTDDTVTVGVHIDFRPTEN